MIRRLAALTIVFGAVLLTPRMLTPSAVSADEQAPALKPTVSLSLTSSAMAEVRQPFRVAVTPAP
ncbi:MAG: hypothetical protein RL134_1128, partial [Actinomycetota bacterium]